MASNQKLHDVFCPGYNSSDPTTWESNKHKIDATIDRFDMRASLTDEELKQAEGLSLEGLAAEVTKFIEDSPDKVFMLGEPAQLTVKKQDGSFSKRPHIGGEDFRITGAYAGKRNQLIFTFRPIDVAEYYQAEFSEKDAKALFSGFSEYIRGAVAGGFDNALRELKKGVADTAERVKNADKFEQYSHLGFGDF